jgi:mono/diheme cytochrome c family protein
MKRRIGYLAGALLTLSVCQDYHGTTRSQERAPALSQERVVINQYCVGCHNEKAKIAGLVLDSVDIANVDAHPEIWEKVLRKLRARYMPPIGRPRPDEKTYDGLVSYLEKSLDRVAAAHPNPGRTDTFRRLNRTEYQNAIRDLLTLDVDVSTLLPADDASYGFDNVGVGNLSPTLVERYLSAAQKVSRLAIGSPLRSPDFDIINVPTDLTQDAHVEGLPYGTRGGTTFKHAFPLDGEYELQLRLTRDRNERIEGLYETHEIEVMLDGQPAKRFTIKPPTRAQGQGGGDYYDLESSDAGLKLRIVVKAGPHDVAAAFLTKPASLAETARQPFDASFDYFFHRRTQPALASISITGPFAPVGAGDTPSRHKIFTCRPATVADEEGCARKIIAALEKRAYRRPVAEGDIQIPLGFYKQARADDGFEAGIETAVRAILVSPQFLFRIENDPANLKPATAYRISDVEMASRLSFFLWSSIPDDELLDLAIAGKLKDPTVLERQVRRMLNDVRSKAVVSNFAGQWLQLRNVSGTSPDPRTFPDFDDNLRQSFRVETELFFESIIKEDRSVLDLLTANYTFLNERLARYYGIPNVYGSRFRRFVFDGTTMRSGLLGQGSILTVTSYATRTSPVLRGKWILENVLGAPPPPPPPNVPPLKDSAGGKVLSMRERMAQHRANPACASCHQLMDPIGFSLENFDAIGRFRNRDESGQPIDASGSLPDGSTFQDAGGLREALLKRPELFVGTITEKLMTYALGRGLEYSDAAEIRKIVRQSHVNNYRLSSIIVGVVNSMPFQMRRSQ